MSCRLLALTVSVLAGVNAARAADPVAWLPSGLNAVARVNVAEIYKTPLAKKEGWLKKASESFIHQEAFIPPGTTQILIGAELDLSNNLASHRKCSVLVPEAPASLEKLAPWLSGGLETISGKTGAQFGDEGYVVDAGDGCWLATMHSSRQTMARWVKNGPAAGGGQLSSYLKSALASRTNSAQMILAIDLQDNFSKQAVAESLKSADWFPKGTSADAVADVVASAQGITIGITVDKERTGSVTLDFEKEAKVLQPILDKFVEAVLQRVGASSDDLHEWKWSVSGRRVTGTGPVSPGGGRRLLSILDPPSITHTISASAEPPADDKTAKTSQKFCKSVRVLLDDLQKNLRKTNDNHALWFERYGRKIDDLPRLNVDGELLDYSAKVSNSLRYQGQVQRMSNIRAGTRTQQSGAYSSFVSGYVSPYGSYAWVKPVDPQAAGTIQAEENQGAKAVRFSEWKQIEDGMSEIRRKMTEKYQIEF